LGVVEYEKDRPSEAQVAVVVPLYNYEAMITECLESVVEQDLQQVSVIVIDDASTDGGGERAGRALRGCDGRSGGARWGAHWPTRAVSMAGNSGVGWGREPYLFMLDA